ncbi:MULTISPECIES: hypothetical protein [unclassified Oceanispirochaeta]|uniref:hypothetical protein n=1 Tax=unclassified Oceanispirochaeta TaxID=2635722 RepID=UPI000E098B0D|nr:MULTISPECIES: hypothetical protein [unclassified Oceanispirochaeta]MBF9015973.1 hypothetical protein [Oceanispirochaeta sp. M2]NPD72436.1 hypothetical protein [Oceanispirochaeta sp. M1]RDG32203.1 hypothetical protein DV872_10020 [Oceanispirochaeta sp. M1]
MKSYQNIKDESEEFSDRLELLEDRAISWGFRKYKLDKVFIREQGPFMDRFQNFPEGYQEFMATSWLFTRIITDPALLQKFARSAREELFPPQNALLKTWKKSIPFWSIFIIENRLEKDVFRIRDVIKEKSYLCCSGSLEQNHLEILKHSQPVITTLIPLNSEEEGHVASYGMLRFYKGFKAKDLVRLYRFMEGQLGTGSSFSSFVLRHYARFFQIDNYMETPVVMHREHRMERIFSEIHLPGFDPSLLTVPMDTKEDQPFIRLRLKDRSLPLSGEILYNRESEDIFLSSFSRTGYEELRVALSSYPIPEEPDFHLPISLYLALEKDMELDLPDDPWKDVFGEEEADKETSPELESINILMGEAVTAQNRGESFDLYTRGKELGLLSENIDALKKVFDNLPKP